MSPATRVRREPTQERSRRTVARILAAAEEIVGESGVEAATTRAIAERAGVAVPSLYRFFADREGVLDAMLEQLIGDLDREARAAEAEWEPDDIGELVGLELDLTVQYFEAHPTLVSLWFGGRASAAVIESVRDRNRDLAGRLREMLVSRDLVRGDTPEAVFELAVELGDRALQVAFRASDEPNQEILELGRTAVAAFLERWAVIHAVKAKHRA